MTIKHSQCWTKIGLNLAYYRKERGLTQQDLAEMSGISRNYVQRIESGNSATVNTLLDISEALNIRLYKLFEFRD